ncbi:MAG: ATP-binding protein [Leptolyngbya sp. SIO4C1]|nr:ATP-binding protein [Leptolyngbya sp. SIO4C1]
MTDQYSDRSIRVERSALGSAVISGDGNTVFVIHSSLELQHEADRLNSAPVPAEIGSNPYKGLAAFKESDAGYYFGRESQVDKLWQRFRDLFEQSEHIKLPHRLLPILGPSGCGKSSLARAGLIPELARRPLLSREQMRVAVILPGAHPIEALASVLVRITTPDQIPVAKTREISEELSRKNLDGVYDGLRRVVDLLPHIEESPLVLLIDQFEHVYSLCKKDEERQIFIDNLLEATSDPNRNFSVILTLRSDFLAEAQGHPILNQLLSDSSVLVPAMSTEELKQAIVQPARKAGYRFTDSMVNLLVEQTRGREGALPLLQFALTQIWEGLIEGKDPAHTLEDIGGVGGALAQEAQRIYDNFSESEKAIVRRLFCGLVQFGEGARYIRKPTLINSILSNSDNPEIFQRVINRLSKPETRLITVSGSGERKSADVVHEAIFEHWQELNRWLDKNKDLIQEQQNIEFAASEWRKYQSNDYLPRGKQLKKAKGFQITQHSEFPLSITAAEYIKLGAKQERRRAALNLSLVASAVLAMIGSAGFAMMQGRHREEESRILSASLQSQAQAKLLPAAYRILQKAERLQSRDQTDQALEYYRKLADYSRKAIEISSIETICGSDTRAFEDIYCRANDSLLQTLEKERFDKLKQQLKRNEIGEIVGDRPTEFEMLFSTGALRTTYALLWREYGIKADINDDGAISEPEAENISCHFLKRLEEIWREHTDESCGWINRTRNWTSTDSGCGQLEGQTLMQSILADIDDYSSYAVLRKLKSCELIPVDVDNH